MPTYCFTNGDGETIERSFPMDRIPRRIHIGKVVYQRDLRKEHSHMRSGKAWPQTSCALGVDRSQVKDAEKTLFEAGVPTQFDARGDAILTSRTHRNKVMNAMGMGDRDAGYGDRAPDVKPAKQEYPEAPD